MRMKGPCYQVIVLMDDGEDLPFGLYRDEAAAAEAAGALRRGDVLGAPVKTMLAADSDEPTGVGIYEYQDGAFVGRRMVKTFP